MEVRVTGVSMSLRRVFSVLVFASVLLLLSERVHAQEEVQPDSLVSITLNDGTTLRGRIVQEDADTISMVTLGGLAVKIPRSSVVSIERIRGRVVGGQFYRSDPNYSRLLLSPTGRPLRKGEGYFSDFYIVLPGIAYGLTDNVSVLAGVSLIPGLGLNEQLFYVAPRIGTQASDAVAVSAGVLYMTLLEEGISGGIVFGVGTFGEEDKSFTVGIGLPYLKEKGQEFQFGENPILMLGGNVRLSGSIALISENWLILGDNFDLGQQPFTLALRFFGERIAVDLGAIMVGELIKEGFPIPLLSFVYHFGT